RAAAGDLGTGPVAGGARAAGAATQHHAAKDARRGPEPGAHQPERRGQRPRANDDRVALRPPYRSRWRRISPALATRGARVVDYLDDSRGLNRAVTRRLAPRRGPR